MLKIKKLFIIHMLTIATLLQFCNSKIIVIVSFLFLSTTTYTNIVHLHWFFFSKYILI